MLSLSLSLCCHFLFLTEYAGCSAATASSGRCHFLLDSIMRTSRTKATIRTPSEFPSTASGGSCEYGCVPLPFPLLKKTFLYEKKKSQRKVRFEEEK